MITHILNLFTAQSRKSILYAPSPLWCAPSRLKHTLPGARGRKPTASLHCRPLYVQAALQVSGVLPGSPGQGQGWGRRERSPSQVLLRGEEDADVRDGNATVRLCS